MTASVEQFGVGVSWESSMDTNIYDNVTARIVAELEQGAAPWIKPWQSGRRNGSGVMPANAATGRCYSGINVPILWMAAADQGYEQPGWMTFQQARKLGAHVRKGRERHDSCLHEAAYDRS